MYVDSAQPGDLILFNRSPLSCSHSPLSALACLSQKRQYDHVAVVVPSPTTKYANAVFEATASEGLRFMDLSKRIRYTMAEEVVILPLNVPGERRDQPDLQPGQKQPAKASKQQTACAAAVASTRSDLSTNLSKVAAQSRLHSQAVTYENMHSSLTLFGGIASRLPLSRTTKDLLYKGPTNPSCMFVLDALHKAGVLSRVQGGDFNGRGGVSVEEVLRRADCGGMMEGGGGEEGGEEVALRPGFRYGKPIVIKS